MGSNCSLPLPPNWDANYAPTSRTPMLPTWDELEPLASFTSETISQEDTHQPTTFRDRLKKELQLRKLIRLPSKALRQKFGHNAILDSGATSSFIKPNGGQIYRLTIKQGGQHAKWSDFEHIFQGITSQHSTQLKSKRM